MKLRLRKLAACVTSIITLASSLAAQETTASETTDETIIELSPFQVDATQDRGYQARNTLAGTRLNTELRDVASAVSVMTDEFLEDIAAVDMQEAFRYSVNTESEEEFFSNSEDGNGVRNTGNNRIRGLTSGSINRNFFETSIRGDIYNSERLTFSRGPNAILYGLGSPAGIINVGLKQARFEPSTELSLRFDDLGSYRATFDANVPANERIAFRFAVLDQDKQGWREPEYDDEFRVYGAMTYRIHDKTTLRMNYEITELERVKARSRYPIDQVSNWIAAGRPLFDHTTMDAADFASIDARGDGRVFIAGGSLSEIPDEYQGLNWAGAGESFNSTFNNTFNGPNGLIPTDTNIHGLASMANDEGENVNATLEHSFLPNLNLELAYNYEDFEKHFIDTLRGFNEKLIADANMFLPIRNETGDDWLTDADGNYVKIPNPNAGRLFVEGASQDSTSRLKRNTFRATLSYELDLRERNKWLGHHTVAGLFQDGKTWSHYNQNSYVNGGDFILGDLGAAINEVRTRYYIDAIGDTNLGGLQYPTEFIRPTSYPTVLGPVRGDPHQKNITRIESEMVALQSKFWDDRIVATYGYRSDAEEVWKAPEIRTGDYWIEQEIDPESVAYQSGSTETMGVVFHATNFLSLHYNRSDNFKPQAAATDFYGTPLGPSTGEGEDYGFTLNLMDGHINTRVNWFTNSANGAIETDWKYGKMTWRLVNRMERWIDTLATEQGTFDEDHQTHFGGSGPARMIRDFESEGFEVEFFANPVRGLDVSLSVANSEAINNRHLPNLRAYVDDRLPTWQKYFDQTVPGRNPDDPNWLIGARWENQWEMLPLLSLVEAEEGRTTDQARKWRVNLVTNYDFAPDGPLGGFSIGGAARWRDRAAIGFFDMPNPADPDSVVPDISRPVYGDEILDLDAWLKYSRRLSIFSKETFWTVQLNVRNLLDDSDPVPLLARGDGSVQRWGQQAPRTFLLTNTFSF